MVCAWPPVLWQEDATPRLHLVHRGTHVLTHGDDAQQPSGQTLWAEMAGDFTAGVAWDWVELRDGVYAIADPLGLVTNLQLLDASGSVLGPFETARRLNMLVHALPWQAEVRRALDAR
jgi:hypothetical protein